MSYRYSQWDGTQQFESPASDELMKQIADEILAGRDLPEVLRRWLQRGPQFQGQRRMGLRELQERLDSMRSRLLQKYNLSSVIDEIKERLDRIVGTEREAIQRRLKQENDSPETHHQSLQKMSRKRLEQLDGLPQDIGGRIKQLRDYDFMDQEARQQFEELMKMLQQQILQNYFKGLQEGIQSITPEALQQIQQMVRDLNQLLSQRLRGEEPDLQDFMKKWGQFFPEGIENLDQLAEHLQSQMAMMESLLKSMTPEMRQQLQDMMNALLRDNRLTWDLMQLAANLDKLHPRQQSSESFPFAGDEPLTMREALDLMGDMNSIDETEREIIQAIRANDASDLDSDEIGRLLGEDARRMTQELQQITRMLEEAGLINRKGDGWELTPRAIRKIGESALQDIFGKLASSLAGSHNLERNGAGNELREETKPYDDGDPFLIDTQKTIMNAVMRQGSGTPVRVGKEDFEVYRTKALTQCSTVIMLDMSYSMMQSGYFLAGRKVALALDTLIRSKFPRDSLYVVAFSYFVLTLKPQMLLDSYWVEYGGGTNFEEALRQARLILNRHKAGTKQIIFISDGQPTSYSHWFGFDERGDNYSRLSGGLQATLREVLKCTKDNITINTFMMEHRRYLNEFVRLMTKMNRGRLFFSTAERLGKYILVDYVNNKRRFVQ
ncbi:MAG: VWA domain-containing protein [Chloroflexi bacterium]|nr:VWA domain-containing protein [Chloroflexota bacterium]